VQWPALGIEQQRTGSRGLGVGFERRQQRRGRARAQLGVLVEQQAVLAAGLPQQQRVVLAQARASYGEPSPEALSRTSTSASTASGWVRAIASRQAIRSSRPSVLTTQ
jgi:hypothetical protein